MNSITVDYEDINYKKLISSGDARKFLNKTCSLLGLANVSFSLSFISEENMHSLNKQYRNIDSPTDILSFAALDGSDSDNQFVIAGEDKTNLGDILICPEVYKRNAVEFKVSEDEELHRLLIHGVLHLSGMDHKTNDMENEPMLKLQEEILSQLF